MNQQEHNHEPNDWKKYIIVFFITLTIFVSGLWISSYLNNKKIDQLKNIESKISLDLMSSETQFSLLQEQSCRDVSAGSILSSELNSLADKISYSENNIGADDTDVVSLKKYYSLLEIKDYLLMKQLKERCGEKSIFVLYFYENEDCDDCTKQGYVLTALREKYPELRVYSFDYNLDLSAIKTMISIYKVPDNLPAIVINGKVHSGFKTLEEIEETFPELETIKPDESEDDEVLDKASTKSNKK
jgi:glutaredoxin